MIKTINDSSEVTDIIRVEKFGGALLKKIVIKVMKCGHVLWEKVISNFFSKDGKAFVTNDGKTFMGRDSN